MYDVLTRHLLVLFRPSFLKTTWNILSAVICLDRTVHDLTYRNSTQESRFGSAVLLLAPPALASVKGALMTSNSLS